MTALTLPRPTSMPPGIAASRLRMSQAALYHGAIRGPEDRAGGVGAGALQATFRTRYFMTQATDRDEATHGIEGVLLAHRAQVVRFLELRGAGDQAEDLFQDLWMRLTERPTGPIANPLSYVMRSANNLMLDRYRAARQRALRDRAWSETAAAEPPSAERALISREQLAMVERTIAATGERSAHIFRRFRVDGVQQRDIAAEMGVSLSTVEADLRKVYAALAAARRQFDAP